MLLSCQLPRFVMTRDAVSWPDLMAHYVVGHVLARERHHIEHYCNQQIKLW